MKKMMVSLVMCSMAVMLLVVDVFGATNRVEQAKEFMRAGMYPQAIALLEAEIYGDDDKGIKAKPANAETHFQLGICYVNQLRWDKADECFASAVQLNPGQYGNRISQVYSQVGKKVLSSGNLKTAQGLYDKAVEYNPDLRKIIANQVFSQGKNYLRLAQFQQAENSFQIASKLDNLWQEIATLYFNLGDSADDANCLQFYLSAAEWCHGWCGDRGDSVGERLKNIAKTIEQKDVFDPRVEQYWKAAGEFINLSPTVQDYKCDTYWFTFDQAGQILDHWIHLPYGITTNVGFASDNHQYEVILKNGKIIQRWNGEYPQNGDLECGFKLKAIQPTIVRLVIERLRM